MAEEMVPRAEYDLLHNLSRSRQEELIEQDMVILTLRKELEDARAELAEAKEALKPMTMLHPPFGPSPYAAQSAEE